MHFERREKAGQSTFQCNSTPTNENGQKNQLFAVNENEKMKIKLASKCAVGKKNEKGVLTWEHLIKVNDRDEAPGGTNIKCQPPNHALTKVTNISKLLNTNYITIIP